MLYLSTKYRAFSKVSLHLAACVLTGAINNMKSPPYGHAVFMLPITGSSLSAASPLDKLYPQNAILSHLNSKISSPTANQILEFCLLRRRKALQRLYPFREPFSIILFLAYPFRIYRKNLQPVHPTLYLHTQIYSGIISARAGVCTISLA